MEATKPSLSHKPFLKKSRTHPTLKKCHKPKQVPYWQLCNDLICGPEPSVDQLWEELRLVAPIKVALASRRPEKRHLYKYFQYHVQWDFLPIWYSRFCRWSLWPTRTPGASQMKRGPCNVSCSSSGRWTSPTCCFAPGYSSFIAMLWWQLLMFRWFLFLCVVGTHLRIFIEPAKVIVVPTKALNTKQVCS